MRRAVSFVLVAAVQFAACSNEPAPANMGSGVSTPPVTSSTGGTPAVASGSTTTPTSTTPTSTSSTATGAAGQAAPVTTTSSGGSPAPSAGGAAGSSSTTSSSAAAGSSATSTGAAGGSAGSGATAAAGGGATAAAGSGGSATSGFKPKCLAKGAELALVGDSWINYPLGQFLAPRLAMRAQKDGALAQGDMYNDQAVAGTSLASGGLGLISDQWAPAKQAAMAAGTSVKFVVMDGGGNDVLLGNQKCLDNGMKRDQDPDCQKTVMDATMVGKMLQTKMKMDGVGQAVYFFYPHVPAGGWDVLDYSLPMAKAVCEGQTDEKYQCYFVDTRDAFQGAGNTGMAMANLIGPDGIHPNAEGDDILADLIWKTMKDHCMAQNASSGCCTP